MVKEEVKISSLPTEIVLIILSLLDPPSLARCQQVCKQWYQLANGEKVWRWIAIQRAYTQESSLSINDVLSPLKPTEVISPACGHALLQVLPEELRSNVAARYQENVHGGAGIHLSNHLRKGDSTGYFDGVETYQDLCKRKWCLDRVWQCVPRKVYNDGHVDMGEASSYAARLDPVMSDFDAAPPYVGAGWDHNDDVLEEVGRDVWRIKIDPTERVLISTGQRGGVRVVDIKTGKVLWRLDRRMTRHFAHLEYDRGLAIYDRVGHGNFEVWKQAQASLPSVNFELFTSLSSPRPTRAFRFQYPILAVATRDGYILLWDVATQKITQEMSLIGSLHDDGNINYIDFDDAFVFLVGTGAKCFSVISRKLGKVIWTLADHFEAGLEGPSTFALESESGDIPAAYASLERRRLKRAVASPWQKASGRQNFAQLMMVPIQSWSAVHPDMRSSSLVVLGQTNILILRDYLKCFLAWERKKQQEILGHAGSAVDVENLKPGLFVDLRFLEREQSDTMFPSQDDTPGQLAVADSRAFCIVGKPMLIDLDPLRMKRNDVRNIRFPNRSGNEVVGDLVSDEEAGFSVYNTINPTDNQANTEKAYTSSLDSCSCLMLDSVSAYAVQMHEAKTEAGQVPSLAMSDYHDVLIWDFSKTAKQHW